jgi:hypothetical protein
MCKRKIIQLIIVGFLLLVVTDYAQAVAFKVYNQTDLIFRMRVHDRGHWRPWAVIYPEYWECPAKSVKRTNHAIEIEVQYQGRWVPFYSNSHGSKMCTRVIHLFKNERGIVVILWHDEPPGCRSKPFWDGLNEHNGCLIKSGWAEKALSGAGTMIAGTMIKAIFAGN